MKKTHGLFKRTTFIFLSLLLIFLCSCSKEKPASIPIGKNFYYWESTADSNPGDAMQNMRNFKKLELTNEHNLMNMFGKDKHYVWIRAEFEIPPQFKNQPLGMVIPHLRFAEQVWLNGTFISQYGNFPPDEHSTLFKAHFFSFPLNILNQEGKNLVLIKVFVYGDSGISTHAFVQPTRFAYPAFENLNFRNARLYMLLFGIMSFTFILYLCLYLNLRDFKEFRDFAFLNLFTSFFIIYFFATELPIYTNGQISHLTFAKFTLCIPGYAVIFLSTLFAVDYYGAKTSLPLKIFRYSILAVQILPTLFSTSYDFLLKISPFMMTLLFLQTLGGIYELITHLVKKETRAKALQFFIGFTPFLIGITIDVAIRNINPSKSYPYITIFGWQGTIAIFIILLSSRFASLYRQNNQLSNHLMEEVSNRTHELEDANYELSILNERLEKDKKHSEIDLEMAALVQKNFFPSPDRHFKGWEISVCYLPQSKVSGDFYDYYSYNDILNGLSLFDVSGHGLSASLVTMLSKNIISRVFQTGYRRKEPVNKVLAKINNMILAEKGDIENYMTGILCRFDAAEDSSKCKVELGNAGHPYPLKFSAEDNEIYELKGNDGKKHYGAIGMKGITVSFAQSDFVMDKNDILILYTDGITEATNSKYEQFGTEKIKQLIKQNHKKPSGEILKCIMNELFEFTQEKPLEDDITLIIAKRTDFKDFIADNEHEDEEDDSIEELVEIKE